MYAIFYTLIHSNAIMSPTVFSISLAGQIESSHIPRYDNLYCKFSFHHGPDWTILTVVGYLTKGLEEGISQLSKAKEPGYFTSNIDVQPCVWNFPIDIAFKSTNVFGWPIIIVTVYGFDFLGRDVIRGYGSLRLPMKPGKYVEFVPLFTPVATTPFYSLYAWLTGRMPEFLDSKFVAKEEGREMTRVSSHGSVKLSFSVISKDFETCGYVA